MKGLLLGLFDRIDIFTVSWLQNVNSTYSRRTARPDLSYQLAFEGPVGLRTEAGDTASRVGDSKALNLSSGVRLPLGASIGVDYGQTDQFLWSPINRTRAQTTTWPNIRLNWNRLPIPGLLRRWLRNWGFRTGYTIRTTESLVLNADQRRDSEVRTLPVNVNLALTTNWSFDYSLTLSDEERRDATGATFGESNNQSVQVTGNIRPLTRTGSFRNPIRVSLRLSQQVQEQCRRLGAEFADLPLEPGEGEGIQRCEPFTDRTIRSVDLTVGTDLPPFTLGLQGTWRDVQSELGQRPGNTQLEISAFGQFQFESGEIR